MVKIYESNPSGSGGEKDESYESQQSLSRWSLISLHNTEGQNIELKFVDKMKRQFQFSVDAFQIHLDTLLKYYDCQDSLVMTAKNGLVLLSIFIHFHQIFELIFFVFISDRV